MRRGLKIFALCLCASVAEYPKHDLRSAGYLYRIFYNSVLTGISKASPEYSTPPFPFLPPPPHLNLSPAPSPKKITYSMIENKDLR